MAGSNEMLIVSARAAIPTDLGWSIYSGSCLSTLDYVDSHWALRDRIIARPHRAPRSPKLLLRSPYFSQLLR